MFSKNKAKRTALENAHIAKIKGMPCAVCGASAPSECHEPEQGLWFVSIPLCADCHRGSKNGLHGQRVMWNIMKKTELICLNDTLGAILANHPDYAAASTFRKSSLASDNEAASEGF